MRHAYTSAKQRICVAYLGVMKVTGKHLTRQHYLEAVREGLASLFVLLGLDWLLEPLAL